MKITDELFEKMTEENLNETNWFETAGTYQPTEEEAKEMMERMENEQSDGNSNERSSDKRM